MFNATGCTVEQFIDSSGNTRRYIKCSTNRELVVEVLRTFDFHYQKKLSSVVVSVKSPDADKSTLFAFVKGAYENVAACSDETSVDLNSLADQQAESGAYVLGLGYKILGEDISSIRRDNVESKLTLGGLLLFNNSVRAESATVVAKLQEAKVRPVILTGDNIPASQFVAKAVGMFGENGHAGPYAEIVDGNLVWHFPQNHIDEETLYFGLQCDNLAVTGDAFDQIEDEWENILRMYGRCTTNKTANETLFEQFLLRVRIFARLNPHQKVRVINAFKRLGIITGMCGDGTNDCLALQASHAGVSLTNAYQGVWIITAKFMPPNGGYCEFYKGVHPLLFRSDNFEAPTVCLWLCYQVVNAALVFSFGGTFRESVLRNTYFTLGTGLRIDMVDDIETQEMADIVIGTPLKLHHKFHVYNLNFKVDVFKNVAFLVIDEADQLVEQTNECDLRRILSLTNNRVKTVLAAATVSTAGRLSTENTITRLFRNVTVVSTEKFHTVPTHIESEFVYCVDRERKLEVLLDVIRQLQPRQRTLIFCNSVSSSARLLMDLKARNPRLDVGPVNRDIDIGTQLSVLDPEGGNKYIVCTDTLARGIDIGDVSLVVQFDFPKNVLDYIHRSGRAGRNMQQCKTVLLWTDEDRDFYTLLNEHRDNLPALFSRKRGLRKKLKRGLSIGEVTQGCADAATDELP
ncbi:putative cation-transporting ATPase [Babesia sp. Xinjiang]|uniref:putative cation-transporting ATPase n=1 Tax=Babesia sp. Xinjiang TaxID=462227 RepID=UPI000A252DE9|nr:putative cation-transporting ATPase [Babesia sp. Xinjiang]ORM41996.1 putative cation-transporting ATPase [Babesia sp. Xinjiang]